MQSLNTLFTTMLTQEPVA